jgi:ribonuclease BN (tRNA processing enzyme)
VKLTFMGTAGARFMVAKQLAASGGLYLELGSTRLAMDPGPGAVVQYAKRKVDLSRLDGILVSHRHLDHCGDVNVVIEAMTEGGFRPRGTLFCPSDALDEDPVLIVPYGSDVERSERELLAVAAEPGLEPFVPRVTLTVPANSAAAHVVFLVTGAAKADAARRAFGGPPDPGTPASLVRSQSGRTTAILDAEAASELSI